MVENTAQGRGLLAEHGLAFWIELGIRRILFDTGQTDILCHNARSLGIDLEAADAIILSHGHYDHTGGLGDILGDAGRKRVFAHPEAFTGKFARSPDGTSREVGMPARTSAVLQESSDITPTREPTGICEGLSVTGPIPRLTDFEGVGGPFFKDEECRRPDGLVDDQAAVVETEDGIAVILGCAHAGIINTLRYVGELFRGQAIHTVIGGTHLVAADETRMDKTVGALREFDVQRFFPLHCTGFSAAAHLWREFPGRVSACPVGTRLDLGAC